MKKLLILISLVPFITQAGILPIAGRYDGAGGAYGAAYQEQFGKNRVIVGAVTGDVLAYGGLLTHFMNKNIEFSLGAASFSDVSLLTTYNRGLTDDEDDQYILKLQGQAVALGSKIWLFSDLITTNLSVTQSTIQFDGYQDNSGEDIEFDQANLFDVETTAIKLGFDLNFYDNARTPSQGVGFNAAITQLSGRTGQSDQLTLDYGFNSLYPFLKHFSFGFKGKYSDAIVDKNSKYDSEDEIRDALDAKCSSVTDSVKRSKCEDLENALVAFILENNTVGSASPLGGSAGLRSFREQRFKAAHTALYTAEINTNLSTLFDVLNKKDTKLLFSIFYDQGYASDNKLELFDESKFSNGAAIRLVKGRGSINLQAASGSDDSSSWSLGFGSAF